MNKYIIVILQQTDEDQPRVPSPPEAFMHARAEHFRTRYRAIMTLVIAQVAVSTVLAAIGRNPSVILIGMLGGSLIVGAQACFAAWSTRKGLLR